MHQALTALHSPSLSAILTGMAISTIPKRLSSAILNSLAAGVVPRIGLEYIAVGRKREIEAILGDLSALAQGAAAFRIITGRYGSGKSFFLQAIRNYGMDQKYLVMDVDLSPEKRFAGSKKQGLETYRGLLQRLSTTLRPEGGALEALLQGWVNEVKLAIIKEGKQPDDPALPALVEIRIYEIINAMENLAHGFDFAAAVSVYYKALLSGDDNRKRSAIQWLRGEYASRAEARQALPVGEIITDENWFDYIKLLAAFSAEIGYQGLILFIDECDVLYKLSNRQSRDHNYEKILSMFNDVMQGKVRHLGLYLAGTPQFIEDERRGLWSYPALKSRLMDNRFARDGHPDYSSPILRLEQLSWEEIYILLERLRDIHAGHYGYTPVLDQQDITAYMETSYSRAGAQEFLTPREITRDFIGALNILKDDPQESMESLLKSDSAGSAPEEDNPYSDFEV